MHRMGFFNKKNFFHIQKKNIYNLLHSSKVASRINSTPFCKKFLLKNHQLERILKNYSVVMWIHELLKRNV